MASPLCVPLHYLYNIVFRVPSYWVNCTRNGNPNGSGLPAWPVFRDRKTSQPMTLGNIEEKRDPAKLALYNDLYGFLMAVK